MNSKSKSWIVLSWLFFLVFIVIGVLNTILIHWVPGLFYILLSFVYFPLINNFLKKKLSFLIPPLIKILLGLVVLWGTLAVGDLMELFESWLKR